MLCSLDIRNVVLIDRLNIEFQQGLCALTGETGAGKSILLDSLGLALGVRADSALLRKGKKQASVTASFQIDRHHPAINILEEIGIVLEDEMLILRRVLSEEGKSRAFINDHPVSVAMLRQVGDVLVEIHGQFETQGLLNPASHRAMLDEYAGLSHDLPLLWQDWRAAQEKLEALCADSNKAKDDEIWLSACVEELYSWEPVAGEEEKLGGLRERQMHREQVLEALSMAYTELNADSDPTRKAYAALMRVEDKVGQDLRPTLDALDRSMNETQEASNLIEALSTDLQSHEYDLESIDDRLFGLRGLARKHGCGVDELPQIRDDLAQKLNMITHGDEVLEVQRRAVDAAKTAYIKDAEKLRGVREKAASRLDKLVQTELAPLKLEKARFVTMIKPLDESEWGPEGCDRVCFLVATNPGAEPGPIGKIASGGELSRFILALKVIIAQAGSIHSFIFDEVDTGIGGSTADAVGERLSRLAESRQVLVVTHAPQIAARADQHWIVQKAEAEQGVQTTITPLESRQERCEEIARMLAGASITKEARAAADKLLESAA